MREKKKKKKVRCLLILLLGIYKVFKLQQNCVHSRSQHINIHQEKKSLRNKMLLCLGYI